PRCSGTQSIEKRTQDGRGVERGQQRAAGSSPFLGARIRVLCAQGQEQAEAPASEQEADRLASSQVPAISPRIGEELRHLAHTPSSACATCRYWRSIEHSFTQRGTQV